MDKIWLSLKKRFLSVSIFEVFCFSTVIFLLVFIVKYFGQQREWKTIRVEIINKNWIENYNQYGYRAPFWLSDKIKIGQEEVDKAGKVIAKVSDVENYIRGTEESEIYITATVQVLHQKKQNKYLYKNRDISLGSAIELDIDNIHLVGQIVDNNVPPSGYPVKTFSVTSRFRSLEPPVFNNIKIGDKMYNRAKAETIAEVTNIKFEDPSRIFLINDSNTFSFKPNRQSKDVIITAKVKASLIDDRWYFAGHQNLKIGNGFYFYADNVNLYGGEIENVESL